ncbi:MAG: chromosome segregation protein SMC [Oscillospiraceae bacterium]
MQLKYIEIQGFKSFPDKTRIAFDHGFAGIVGPNGSGKSNISDAVRWVLGEQSTKSLRGDKMEDVIFGGTQLRKAMGFAQVSLCLDNTDKRIDSSDEIIVARRYYRSGDSEYVLNGATVRLRDVREMFMDTGLGRDGYSIIGQGKIAEVVSAKSTERREIFEEASGIAKFRFRKNEAVRKLEGAEDNLERLRDIIGELEGRIEPLMHQSEKALQFLELSKQKKELEITLYCNTIERARDSLRTQDDKVNIAKNDYSSIEERLADLNKSVEESFEKGLLHNANIESFNREIVSYAEQAAEIESSIAVLQNDILHSQERIAELTEDKRALSESGNALQSENEKKKAMLAEMLAELELLDSRIKSSQDELLKLAQSSEISDKNRAEAAHRLSELKNEATEQKVAIVSAQSSAESLEAHEEITTQQLRALSDRLAQSESEHGKNDEYLKALLADIADRENKKRGFEMKLSAREQEFEKLCLTLEQKDKAIAESEQKMSVLTELDKSMEGFFPSVRRVVEASKERRLRGIVGTVASLIEIKKGCETAIEIALGASIQNIVVEDERAARDAISFLKDSKTGRATFLPIDTVKPSSFDLQRELASEGVVGLASTLVTCDRRYADIISSLLGRIIVTQDLDTASSLARRISYKYRIVTMDGQVVNAGGSYTGGFISRQAGVFSRKNEIEELRIKSETARNATVEIRKQHQELKNEIVSLKAEVTAFSSELITCNEDKIRAESEQKRHLGELATLRENIENGEAELVSTAKKLAEKRALIANAEDAIAMLTEESGKLERASFSEGAETFLKRSGELSEELSAQRIKRAEQQKDIEGLQQSISTLEKSGGETTDRFSQLSAAIDSLMEENLRREQQIEDRRTAVERIKNDTIAKRRAIDDAVSARQELQKESLDTRAEYDRATKQREEIGSEIARLEERKTALQKDYDQYISRLWEEYELTRTEAEKLCVEFESITELRQQVGQIRSKIKALGSVNVAAIDEFKEVSERYKFMTVQVGDIERSKAELIRLIESLESEMAVLFTKSFNEINNRFRVVFVELFGGGSATLSLTDETDVLESGIELDVQPPGKVIKNLASLSGGEQSLVAIALYFAILAVNPSPFCILDEIDSALDDSNVLRFADYIKRVSKNTQIIAITHRRGTMEAADILYGVTMQEEGVSKLLRLGIEEAQLVLDGKAAGK